MKKLFIVSLMLTAPFLGRSAQDRPPVRFVPYDVMIDTGDRSLSAWQLEVKYDRDRVAILSLEGGAKEPFPTSRPPQYDSRGFRGGRILLADFTTAKAALPEGKFRIARLHVQVAGDEEPGFELKLLAAAQPGGARIPATLSIEKMKETE